MNDKPVAATDPVGAKLNEATDKGYLGANTDPTPDSAYTVAGVTSGAQTPETQEPGTPGSTKTDPDKVGTGYRNR